MKSRSPGYLAAALGIVLTAVGLWLAKTFPEAAGAMAAQLSNQIEGRWVSRFYDLQTVLSGKMDAARKEYEDGGERSARVSALNGGLNQIGYTLSYSGTLIVGLILVNAGRLTLPEMLSMWPLSLGIAFGLLQIGFLFINY